MCHHFGIIFLGEFVRAVIGTQVLHDVLNGLGRDL